MVLGNEKPKIKAPAYLVSREGLLFIILSHVEGVSSLLTALIAVVRVDPNHLPEALTPHITILEFRILTYASADMQSFAK